LGEFILKKILDKNFKIILKEIKKLRFYADYKFFKLASFILFKEILKDIKFLTVIMVRCTDDQNLMFTAIK